MLRDLLLISYKVKPFLYKETEARHIQASCNVNQTEKSTSVQTKVNTPTYINIFQNLLGC